MANNPTDNYSGILKDLAHTMMSVSRESVNLIKRSDQQQALKLQRKQEWDIYLEFLRMLFNLVDLRLADSGEGRVGLLVDDPTLYEDLKILVG